MIGADIIKSTNNNLIACSSKEGPKLRKFSDNLDLFDETSSHRFDKELKRKRSFSEGEVLKTNELTKKILKPVLSKNICDINDHNTNSQNTSNAIRIQVSSPQT